MKNRLAILSLLLVVFSVISCDVARPLNYGISSEALGVVRPVFGLWKQCNVVIDVAITDIRNHDPALIQDVGKIYEYCQDTYIFIDGIKLKGNLAQNTAMKDALEVPKLFAKKEYYSTAFYTTRTDGL